MERATRVLVFAWACAALAFEVHWVARGWGEFQTFAALLFAVMLGLSFVSRRAVGVVLATTYVLPVVVMILHGDYFIFFEGLWLAALLGAMASDCLRGSWNVPAPWRAPLVCWALTACVGTTIVVLREIDFDPALFDSPWILWSSQIGVAPSFAVTWVAYVGVTLVVGILWFDWLFGLSADDFRAAVLAPLLGSALVMAGVAAYQLLGHSLFLNETIFGAMGRAAGTLRDANLCAAVAALWTGGAIVWSERLGRARPPVVAASWLLGAAAVWAAGSRTGLALMLVVGAFVAVGLYSEFRFRRPTVMRAAAVGCVALMALGLYFAQAHLELVGPVRRLADMLPSLSATSFRNFFAELWNRNRYGIAATAMIRDFPLVGVGAGAYQILVPDYAAASSPGGWIIPDNAQNWYRHQIAEFGLLGSLGWIAWTGLFAWFVLRRPGRASSPLAVWTLRGMLVGLALISLLGMPTQDALLAITFWTLAFWYASTVGIPASAEALGWRAWAVVFVVVLAFGVGTADVARTRLRPPMRAQRFGWPYTYGFYDAEPDGHGGEFRWTGRRAVSVLDVKGMWLAITVSTNHRDLDRWPDDARVWCDGRLVVRARLRSAEPVTEYVRVPNGEPRLLLETHSSRVVKPRDEGLPDDRELGLMVSWKFVDAAPSGAAAASVQ